MVSKATLDALSPGDVTAVEIDGRRVAIGNSDGEFCAFDDVCTHAECPLSDGEIEDGSVVCPCHGSAFDVRTGEVVNGPATDPIAVFPLEIDGDEVRIKLS